MTLLEPLLSIHVTLNGDACDVVGRSNLLFEVPLSPQHLQSRNELEIVLHPPLDENDKFAIDKPQFGKHYLAKVELVLN